MTTFNFSFDPGTSVQQMTGFEIAGRIWSAYLKDNTTVNIHVGVSSNLPTGVIGGALPGIRASQNYAEVRNHLQADRTTADDNLAFQNMQDETDKYTAFINGFKVDNNTKMNVTRANAKGLGLLNDSTAFLDGYILMSDLANQSVTWNYDYTRTTAAPANQLDFLSTAIHEVGHLLGFVSGIDKPGWLSQTTQYNQSSIDDYFSGLTGQLDNTTVLDLYRYTSQSLTAGGLSEHWLDLSVGGNPYFSINGGQTPLAYFSTGEVTDLGGDGQQASHWKNQANPLGIMNPTLAVGKRPTIAALDLRVFDVIGWNVASTGINTTINLATMQAQAKQSLATRLGQTVTWLDANSTLAAQQLGQNREQDIAKMIDQSKVYEWGWEDDDPFWQRIQNLYFQQGLFQQFEPQVTSLATAPIAINWGNLAEVSIAGFTGSAPMPLMIGMNQSSNPLVTPASWGENTPVNLSSESLAPTPLGLTGMTFTLTEGRSPQSYQLAAFKGWASQTPPVNPGQPDWLKIEGIEQI
jgi:hypothetical protein